MALSPNLTQAVALLDSIDNESNPTPYGRPDISALTAALRLITTEVGSAKVTLADNGDGTASLTIG